MAEEVKDAIKTSATEGVRRAQGDQGSVEMHSLPDQIAADKHLARKAAGRNPFSKIGRSRISPPGGTGT